MIAHHQLDVAQQAGFALGSYCYSHPSWGSGSWAVGRALDRIEGFPVRFLALDVEEDGDNFSTLWPQWVADAVKACEAAGVVCVIYTSRSMWRKLMANTTAYAHLLLWDASYGALAFQSYGGWTKRAIWQHQGTTDLCGTQVDLNRA